MTYVGQYQRFLNSHCIVCVCHHQNVIKLIHNKAIAVACQKPGPITHARSPNSVLPPGPKTVLQVPAATLVPFSLVNSASSRNDGALCEFYLNANAASLTKVGRNKEEYKAAV